MYAGEAMTMRLLSIPGLSIFRLILTFAGVALASRTPQALAWGDEGHIIVAVIAEHYLAPPVRERVHALLAIDGADSLAAVATWADEIKSDRPDTKRWHYVDIPVCGAADRRHSCPYGACITRRIERFARVLEDRDAEPAKRVEALKFLTHLVADVHQPLHTADNRDHGGNDIHVTFFGRSSPSLNLHAIWDTDMIRRFSRDPSREARKLIDEVSRREVTAWSAGTVDDWAAESHALAVGVAYARLPGGFSCDKPGPNGVVIGRRYYRQARPVIERQLEKAGVRLAFLLNQELGGSSK
jgi:hypothetical protein